MNKDLIIDPLSGLEYPARLVVRPNNGHIKTCLQITAPQDQTALCLGRPVEELPRILGLISPAHHLVAALTLDRLFGVEPPGPAQHLRQALLQAHFHRHGLRKIFFLAKNWPGTENGFQDGIATISSRPDQRNFLDRIGQHLVLIQEACSILGGRCDHPLTAAAGGLTRAPKTDQCARLEDIAGACLDHARSLAEILRDRILENSRTPAWFAQTGPKPMTAMVLDSGQDQIVLFDPAGAETDRFPLADIFSKLDERVEPFSYLPFAFLRDQGYVPVLEEENTGCFVHTGPLARMTGPGTLGPLAREEKQRLGQALGTIGFDSPAAAYWSLVVELLDSAERLKTIPFLDKSQDLPLRNVPTAWKNEALAALESPAGLICHQYRVNSQGLVQAVRILDSAAINNARRCAVAARAVEAGPEYTAQAVKIRAELSLWPH